MSLGSGKYDDLATLVRERSRAQSVVVIVIDGERGSGFSVQSWGDITAQLPFLLRDVADKIEASALNGSQRA